MRPPKRGSFDYERIKVYDEWIPGIIEDIKLEEDRLTGFTDEETGEPTRKDMIRFKFKLEGHKFGHYSRWMSYGYGEKSNLFKKYLVHLVEDAQPDMDFDLDSLIGMRIKTMWSANADFDNLDQIRAVGEKAERGKMSDPQAPAKIQKPHDAEEPPEIVGGDEEDEPF